MKEDIQQILEKYSRNACTKEELQRLEAWFLETGSGKPGVLADDARLEQILQRIKSSPRFASTTNRSKAKRSLRRIIWASTSIAALLLLGIGLALYGPILPLPTEEYKADDIIAGKEKAILTLADGRKIVLDEQAKDTLAREHGITIHKNADNILTYTLEPTTSQHPEAPVYNTIETPRGGEYQVVLSDGSQVWLNSESSLTFPSRFSAHSREVHVQGEAYFSVVPREMQAGTRTPFIVHTNRQRLEVLGTEFNVNTYPEQSRQRTTLVEGSVRVIHQANGQRAVLEPGQQAQIGTSMKVVQADLEKEIAWKQGDFIFKNDRLPDILQQVSRWYDITVSYPANRAGLRYSGMVSRKQPLSSIIAMLESTGTIQVNIKERRIIIE